MIFEKFNTMFNSHSQMEILIVIKTKEKIEEQEHVFLFA